MYQEILPQIRKIGRQAGMTLLELIIACAILLILADKTEKSRVSGVISQA